MLYFIIFSETVERIIISPVSTTIALLLSSLLFSIAKRVALGNVCKFVHGCEIIIIFSLLPKVFMSSDQQKEDCYFYTDISLLKDEQEISALCMECYKKHQINGWFWEGSRLGYGPYDFICSKCGHEIHKMRG
jgi:hypothetical protein